MADDLWAVSAEHVDARPRIIGDDEAVLVPARLSEAQMRPLDFAPLPDRLAIGRPDPQLRLNTGHSGSIP